VHGFAEFVDGSVIAQMSPPDMRLPIQHALTWPHRAEGCSPRLDWSTLRSLEFEPVDHERFPALRLAERVIETGGGAGAVFNAANEVAVEAFLAGRISFPRIAEIVAAALEAIPAAGALRDLADASEADATARAWVEARVGAECPGAAAPASSR
jgi:1-deoxy-D-xylulose-5-phosphate reductoisomerase